MVVVVVVLELVVGASTAATTADVFGEQLMKCTDRIKNRKIKFFMV
jgi:hypothetical protein